MELVWSVLYLGSSGIEACAKDSKGTRRKVNVTWHRKDRTDVPPEDWPKMIEGELAFQDSEKVSPSLPRRRLPSLK